MNTVRIGTRDSALALAQAELVAGAIRGAGREVVLAPMKSLADMYLETSLEKLGGKGVFVKELDEALLRGEVDFCVHSCKDMPGELHPDLSLVAVGPREDPRDVLVLPQGVTAPDPAKPIGCSSLRRRVQLAALYPEHKTAPIRGNIITRLAKLDRGDFGALVLAAAGLRRVGLEARISRAFSVEEMIPAAGQGVVAVQGRRGEAHDRLGDFHCPDAWDATVAERACVRTLGCGCGAPVGVYATVSADTVQISALVADEKGDRFRDRLSGPRSEAEALGVELARRLLERQGQYV